MQLEFLLLQLVTDIAMTKQTILTATMMDLTVAEILLIQNSALTVHVMVNSSLGTIQFFSPPFKYHIPFFSWMIISASTMSDFLS